MLEHRIWSESLAVRVPSPDIVLTRCWSGYFALSQPGGETLGVTQHPGNANSYPSQSKAGASWNGDIIPHC